MKLFCWLVGWLILLGCGYCCCLVVISWLVGWLVVAGSLATWLS